MLAILRPFFQSHLFSTCSLHNNEIWADCIRCSGFEQRAPLTWQTPDASETIYIGITWCCCALGYGTMLPRLSSLTHLYLKIKGGWYCEDVHVYHLVLVDLCHYNNTHTHTHALSLTHTHTHTHIHTLSHTHTHCEGAVFMFWWRPALKQQSCQQTRLIFHVILPCLLWK